MVDNMFEEQQFFRERKGSRLRRNTLGPDECDAEYGSRAYFDFFHSQKSTFEFLFARESFSIKCFLDSRGYFFVDPPSLGFVSMNEKFSQVSEWRKIFPFASIDLNRSILHYVGSSATDKISFSSGAATIVDTTDDSLVSPTLLQIIDPSSENGNGYGYSEFRFDFSEPQDLVSPSRVPIKIVSLYNNLSNWRTTSLEMLEPDVCSRDLRPLWLLIDYFSAYFRSPTYGNPYCFDFLHDGSSVYGGSDLRMIFWKPLVMVMKEPSSKETQYVILESCSFIAYRIMTDSAGSFKVSTQANDLALVLIKQLRPINRGLRGAAGSGRGVRTVLEHLTLRFVYHFNSVLGSTDLIIDILSSGEQSNESVFDWDEVSVFTSHAVQTTCVENMDVFPRVFPKMPVNFVSSFADVMLCMSLLSSFIEVNAEPVQHERNIFCVVRVTDLRLIVVDNVVGLHLPLVQAFVEDISITIDGGSILPIELDTVKKYRLFGTVRCFADYFNYSCRCWEPMMEPVICESIYEQLGRCRGLSIRSRSNFHINLSGESIKAISNLTKAMGDDYPVHVSSSAAFELDVVDAKNRRSPQLSRRSSISMSVAPLVENVDAGDLLHLPSQNLAERMRVGFSILNATGQALRYLVDYGDNRKVVRYLNNGERGILNFPATQLIIRNNTVVEEAFDVQKEAATGEKTEKAKRRTFGHMIGLQISGYQWIETEADVVGARYEELNPVIGRRNPNVIFKNQEMSWKRLNALRLVAEVNTTQGSRLLKLRSVFEIRNNTHHDILVSLSTTNEFEEDPTKPFKVTAGETLYVPLALLQRSILASNGASLGAMKVRPADISIVRDELNVKNNMNILRLNYSAEPVEFIHLVEYSYELLRAAATANAKFPEEHLQMVCHVDAQARPLGGRLRERVPKSELPIAPVKLAPFIYNVEVMREGAGADQILRTGAEKTLTNFFKSYLREDLGELRQDPLHYSLIIQPPIIIENLLPAAGRFTIINTRTKAVLWSRFLECGESRYIIICSKKYIVI